MDSEENQNQTPPNPSAVKAAGVFIWDLVKILIVALVIIVPFRTFIAEPFVVSGSSMLPTFHHRDYLIIDRLSYRTGQPKRGDIIVLKFPKDTSQYFIKRIIGLPGETVKFSQGHVTIINQDHPEGWELKEPYLLNSVETFGQSETTPLGSDEYYVLGDNRTASSDSRVWGRLPKNDIVGKVWVRVFPFGNFGKTALPSYQ